MIWFCAEVTPTVSNKAKAESSADLSMNASIRFWFEPSVALFA
jgi:hypothetical protein